MKKLLSLLLSLSLVLTPGIVSTPGTAAEESFGFEYRVSESEATITAYTGFDSAVEIPSTLDGFPVTGIAFMAFSSKLIDYLTIPASIVDIAPGAFAYSSIGWLDVDAASETYMSRENVLFDKSEQTLVAQLGDSNAELVVPDGVTRIESYAFVSSRVERITIPATVTSIGEHALSCLRSIEVDPANADFCVQDGVLYDKRMETLLRYPSDNAAIFAIPSGTLRIAEGAFEWPSRLTNIVIPGYVVDWPAAFANSYDLRTATLLDGISLIPAKAFANCSSLTTVVVPASVDGIGSEAFSSCYSLRDVYFTGNAPTQVAADAFMQNPMVHVLSTSTGWDAPPWNGMVSDFYDTGDTYTVTFDPNHATAGSPPVDPEAHGILDLVTVPGNPGTLSREGYTFHGWNTEADGTGVLYPEGSALQLLAPADVVLYADWYGDLTPGEYREWTADGLVWSYQELGDEFCLIFGCGEEGSYSYSRTSLVVPSILNGRKVQEVSFNGIGSGLESVTIPEGVVRIGMFAFAQCSGLQSVTIPGTVRELGVEAFSGCTKLTGLVLPDGLKEIGESAFRNCMSLTSLVIPAGVASIGNGAFNGCLGLSGIDVAAGNPAYESVEGILFDESLTTLIQCPARKTGDFAVPDSVTRILAGAFSDSRSVVRITIPASVTTIEPSAFRGTESLAGIDVSSQNPVYASVEGVLFDKSLSTLLACPGGKAGTFTVPEGTVEIGESAFAGCTGLTEAVLPASLCRIGFHAFRDSGLTHMELPEGLTDVPWFAFTGCTDLQTMTLPSTLTSIGWNAFSSCTSLESIVLPDGLLTIDSSAFANCRNLTGVTIPESVTYIGESAFENCRSLSSISIPGGVGTIGGSAFSGCTALSSVVFEEGLQCIYYGAFNGCSSLTELEFPDSLETILGAFAGCTSLEAVAFGSGLRTCGQNAFQNCERLTRVSFAPGTQEIPEGMFQGCAGLTDVTLPEGLLRIGDDAFADCTGLAGLSLPGTLESIGDAAFARCTGLLGLVLPNAVTTLGAEAFVMCSGLTDITLPSGLTALESKTFAYCTGLTHVALPDGLVRLGDNVFIGCSLTGLRLPASLREISAYGFSHTSLPGFAVDALNLDFEMRDGVLYSQDGTRLIFCPGGISGTYAIPEGVTSVGHMAFHGCAGITGISVPASVATIGNGAFEGCPDLERIDVSSDNLVYASIDGMLVDSTKTRLIGIPDGLTGVLAIPDGITDVAYGAFSGNAGLTEIIVPASVTFIPSESLMDLASLTSFVVDAENPDYSSTDGVLFDKLQNELLRVPAGWTGPYDIPEGTTSVREQAFQGCTGLTGVTFPASLSTLSYGAFQDCTSLTSLSIPESLDFIGLNAFSGCTSLTQVFLGRNAILEGMTFANCTALTDVTLEDGRTSLGWYAFQGCTSLVSIALPDTLTTLGQSTFSGCTSLSGIVLPDSVHEIEYADFEGCTSLTSIVIPDTVTVIRERAFSGCTGLQSVRIGRRVSVISALAFEDCSLLETVNIPDSVTWLSPTAFHGCTSLSALVFAGNAPDAEGGFAASAMSFGLASASRATAFSTMEPVLASIDPVIYHRDWTLGWTRTWNGLPTVEFDPQAPHAVLYDGNGATGGTVPTDAATYRFEAQAVVLGNPGLLEKPGSRFAGWNTKPDGSGIDYAPDGLLTVGIQDVTLYAQWIRTLQEITVVHAGQVVSSGFVPTVLSCRVAPASTDSSLDLSQVDVRFLLTRFDPEGLVTETHGYIATCDATGQASLSIPLAQGTYDVEVQTVEDSSLTLAARLVLPGDLHLTATGPNGATAVFAAMASCASGTAPNLTYSHQPGASFPVGTTTVTCTASFSDGRTLSGTFQVTVGYAFRGFFQPIDNNGVVNVVKAGSAIPVQFSLGGDLGLSIFAFNAPYSVNAPYGFGVMTFDNVELTVSASKNGLSYDPATGRYTYVWKTDKAWAGTYRQLRVVLKDGSEYTANFRIR